MLFALRQAVLNCWPIWKMAQFWLLPHAPFHVRSYRPRGFVTDHGFQAWDCLSSIHRRHDGPLRASSHRDHGSITINGPPAARKAWLAITIASCAILGCLRTFTMTPTTSCASKHGTLALPPRACDRPRQRSIKTRKLQSPRPFAVMFASSYCYLNAEDSCSQYSTFELSILSLNLIELYISTEISL